jgi:hypothetical protein
MTRPGGGCGLAAMAGRRARARRSVGSGRVGNNSRRVAVGVERVWRGGIARARREKEKITTSGGPLVFGG